MQALVELLPEGEEVGLARLWQVAMVPSISSPPLLRKMIERRVSELCGSKKGRQILKKMKK